MNNKRTYITLFSSAGVGCYGFKLNGFECVVTNDAQNHPCQLTFADRKLTLVK